jgi:hypothetical protein
MTTKKTQNSTTQRGEQNMPGSIVQSTTQSKRPWTQSEYQQMAAMIAKGTTWAKVAEALNRPSQSCRTHFYKVRAGLKNIDPVPVPKSLKKARQAIIEPQWSEEMIDPAKLWEQAEVDAEKRITKALKHARFNATLPSNRVSAISFISDQHIAPGTPVDFKRMRLDAELIAGTDDLYAILGGDGIDNHIKHHSAMLAARSQPHDQYVLYEHYLRILSDSLLVATSGNHDLWTNQYAGVDVVSMLCKANKIAYAPYEARVNVKIGSQLYKVAMRHQFRLNSSFNQTHSVKQWLRLGEEEFDIGCIGHHHEAAVESTIYRGLKRWVCRPGAYQITSSYSMAYGWNAAIPTCPTFLIYPNERKIVGFDCVREAVKMLRAEND